MKITTREENIAAITATFHQDKRWRSFYETNRDALSGFPGIWVYCVEAGRAFTVAEKKIGVEWDGEWIDAIEAFSDALFVAAKPLNQKELEEQAVTSIKAALYLHTVAVKVQEKRGDFYVLQMEDGDQLEDHHYVNCYVDDHGSHSWLTMDRRDMWQDAMTFKTEAEARAKFAEVGGGEKERVTLVYVDAEQFIHEIAVLYDTFTK
jgi:hypothetical protein